jgi:hypothetical protein
MALRFVLQGGLALSRMTSTRSVSSSIPFQVFMLIVIRLAELIMLGVGMKQYGRMTFPFLGKPHMYLLQYVDVNSFLTSPGFDSSISNEYQSACKHCRFLRFKPVSDELKHRTLVTT